MRWYTKLLIAALLCFTLILLTGCGWKGQGVVVEKTHSDSYMVPRMQCMSYNKGVCTGWLTVYDYIPEAWGYRVKDSKGEVHQVSTSRSDWEAHRVGDHFNNED